MATTITASQVLRCLVTDYVSLGHMSVDTSNRLLGLARAKEYGKIIELCDQLLSHTQYSEKLHVISLRQVRALFSKNASYRSKVGDDVAFANFLKCEEKCRATNARLDLYADSFYEYPVLLEMQRIIASVLGDFRKFREEFLPFNLKFSSGASANSSRGKSRIPLKVSKTLETTNYAFEIYKDLFPDRKLHRKECNTNRLAFVPKNYKTSRTIACEPRHSMPLQLAFDSYCKRRLLLKAGVNLSDQSLNQLASFKGSLDGSLCTLDLANASDTVSYNVVALLFPVEWFEFLRGIRSPYWKAEVNGVSRAGSYAKFSSMGNGTTFPIETLIFYAACKAIGSKTAVVYGDDIVLDDDKSLELVTLLGNLGFDANVEKTFSGRTPFRESCGTDWHSGTDVTPFYMRQNIVANIEDNGRLSIESAMNLSHLINSLQTRVIGPTTLAMFRGLIKRYRLLRVPFSESTEHGVWSDVRLRHEHSISYYRGYMRVNRLVRIKRSLAYFYSLYNLSCGRLGEMSQDYLSEKTSFRVGRYTHSLVDYDAIPVRLWVNWAAGEATLPPSSAN